jgi:hypothetical protein
VVMGLFAFAVAAKTFFSGVALRLVKLEVVQADEQQASKDKQYA